MKLIIDAMGGDNAPLEIVKGALSGQKRWGVDVTLTGDTTAILQALEACGEKTLPQGMEIIHTTETVEMCDDPATVFRRDGLLSPSSQICIFSLYYTHFCGVCQREKFTYSWPPAPWRPCPHTPRRTGSAGRRSRYPWCRPPCACRDSACGRST